MRDGENDIASRLMEWIGNPQLIRSPGRFLEKTSSGRFAHRAGAITCVTKKIDYLGGLRCMRKSRSGFSADF